MTTNGIVQLVFYVVVLLVLAKPLGAYMARVYEGRRLALDRALSVRFRSVGISPVSRISLVQGIARSRISDFSMPMKVQRFRCFT